MKAKSTKKWREYQKDLRSNPYVNGVRDSEGNNVIRPLNEEERLFLEKFNNEFVEGDFKRDSDNNITEDNLHYHLINSDKIKEIKDKIKEVGDELRKTNNYREMNDRKAYWKYKKNLYKQYDSLKEELKTVDISGEIYNNKYARRFDTMAYLGKSERTILVTDLFSTVEVDSNEGKLFEYLESTKI